jgi:hypothetical protein
MERAPLSHRGGPWFESKIPRLKNFGGLAQAKLPVRYIANVCGSHWIAYMLLEHEDAGSNPAPGTVPG